MSGKTATQRNLNIYIPDGENGEAAVDKYDPEADIVFRTIAPNNIALIRLDQPIVLDGSKEIYFF